MGDLEFDEWLKSASGLELTSLVESLFSLDFLRCDAVTEAILSFEQDEEVFRIESLSDEEVFTKYMEFNELLGTPVNLSEYLADRREWEYECQSGAYPKNYWQEYEDAVTEHALALLEEYENRTNISRNGR